MDFYRFWPNFYNTAAPYDGNGDFRDFLTQLLQPVLNGRPARIISVFSNRQEPPASARPAGSRPIRISYSGEGHHNEPVSDYDLNLIMKPTDTAAHAKTVCLPLFIVGSYMRNYWPIYQSPRSLNPGQKQRFCCFVVSNGSATVRNRFFQKLNKYKPVHSCGRALNNCGMVAPLDLPSYFKFLSQFKFMICFENRALPEYLTEKLHNAWLGGTVPIYWGADRAQEWLNPEAFLQLPTAATEADMDALVQRVAALDNDPEAYAAMHAQPLLKPDVPLPPAFDIQALRQDIATVLANS